jgi:hypothetical protein
MLVRLLYASRAVDDVSQEELMTILSQSKAHNPASGITGVLCSSGRLFLQLLEGDACRSTHCATRSPRMPGTGTW